MTRRQRYFAGGISIINSCVAVYAGRHDQLYIGALCISVAMLAAGLIWWDEWRRPQ